MVFGYAQVNKINYEAMTWDTTADLSRDVRLILPLVPAMT